MRVAILALAIAAASTAKAEPVPDIAQLEVQVWTGEDAELPSMEKQIVRFLQAEPQSAMAHQLLCHVLLRQFAKEPADLYTLKQAATLAQQAVDLMPKEDNGYVAMADVFDMMGSTERSLKILDDAERNGVRASWRIDFTRARLNVGKISHEAVLGLFEKALQAPGARINVIAPYVVGTLQTQKMADADFIAKLQAWNKRFPSPLFELSQAIRLAEMGKSQEAHKIYESLIRKDPDQREARVNDAILLYRNLNEPAKAVANLEKVLAQSTRKMPQTVKAIVYAHLGAAFVAQKNYPRAEANFKLALETDMRNRRLLDFMKGTYRDAKAHAPLVSLLRVLNDSLPATGDTHSLLGETLSENLSRHDEALRAFADAITLNPNRSEFYNSMGLTYYRMRAYKDALELFMAASQVDPQFATARYNEACMLALMGRSDDAIDSLGEALALDPRLSLAAQADGDLRGLHGNVRFRDMVQLPTEVPGVKVAH